MTERFASDFLDVQNGMRKELHVMKKIALVTLFFLGVLNVTGQTRDSRREIRPFTGRRFTLKLMDTQCVTGESCDAGYVPPPCGDTMLSFVVADWSDGSWVEREISWCSVSGNVLSCNRSAGCAQGQPTCMALDSPQVLVCP